MKDQRDPPPPKICSHIPGLSTCIPNGAVRHSVTSWHRRPIDATKGRMASIHPPASPVVLVLQELELLLDAIQGLGVSQLEGLWGGGA